MQLASPLGRSPVRYDPVGFKDFAAHASLTGGLVERILASLHHNAPTVYREFRVFVHTVRGYEFPTSTHGVVGSFSDPTLPGVVSVNVPYTPRDEPCLDPFCFTWFGHELAHTKDYLIDTILYGEGGALLHNPAERTGVIPRYGRALSLILCDIDFFKNINDTLGHAAGDDILKQFAARLQESLRRGIDWVARIGGEEFAIVLPETGYEQALGVARKLRAGVADRGFSAQSKNVEVTASFGLCGLDRVSAGERKTPEHILKIADAALYRSKHAGRNRVTATILPTPGR